MLEIKNLKKNYKDFSLDCSFEVKKGQITGLIGQNGAGKSTIFRALLSLISFEGGTIRLFDKDISELTLKDRENIGVVLSDSGFSGYLRIKEIVSVLKNMYSRFDCDFFLEQVKHFRLPMDKKIKDFSSGMKAKLKVLAAISHRPRLLILDEATAGLDVIARDELLVMLKEYMEQNEESAILISSHISSDLETLCDDIYMISDGEIVLHEDTDVLLSNYATVKIGKELYSTIDNEHILYGKEEAFGYTLLTNEKGYYLDNYPNAVVENATIDSIMHLIIKGERV